MKVTKHFFVSYHVSNGTAFGFGNTTFTCETDDDPPTQPELRLAQAKSEIEEESRDLMSNPKVIIISFQEISQSQKQEFQNAFSQLP